MYLKKIIKKFASCYKSYKNEHKSIDRDKDYLPGGTFTLQKRSASSISALLSILCIQEKQAHSILVCTFIIYVFISLLLLLLRSSKFSIRIIMNCLSHLKMSKLFFNDSQISMETPRSYILVYLFGNLSNSEGAEGLIIYKIFRYTI